MQWPERRDTRQAQGARKRQRERQTVMDQFVTKRARVEVRAKRTTVPPAVTADELSRMKVSELRSRLKGAGLRTQGKRNELLERLEAHLGIERSVERGTSQNICDYMGRVRAGRERAVRARRESVRGAPETHGPACTCSACHATLRLLARMSNATRTYTKRELDWCTGEVEDADAARRENLKDELTDYEDGTIPAASGGEIIGQRMIVRSAGGHREHVCVEVDYVKGDTWEGWQVWHIPRYVWDRGKQQWPAVENMDALTLADAKQHIRRWRELRTRDFTSPPNLQ